MLSFTKTSVDAPTPVRTSSGIQLITPFSVSILPNQCISLDLQNSVRLPIGCLGFINLNQRSIKNGDRLQIHADIIGKKLNVFLIPYYYYSFFQRRIVRAQLL